MIDTTLHIFYKAAQRLNFSEVAQEMYLTQPAVTFQIKKLESHLGTNLFYREKNRVALTEAGEVLYRHAKRILDCYEEAEREVGKISGTVQGRVLVGASTTMAEYILPRLFGQLKERYPRMEPLLMIGNSDRILDGVIRGTLDVGILAEEVVHRELHQEKILQDQLVLIAAPNHPIVREKKVTPEVLCRYPFIAREQGSGTRKETEIGLEKAGMHPRKLRISMRLERAEAIKGAVEADLGIAILSRWAIRKELRLGTLKIVPMQNVRLVRDFKLIRYKKKQLSPSQEHFVDFLRNYDWQNL
ncbi:MAG: LysR family transcriptional regulator [Deltaproteobacteria bacterium]|nr:LysR family transcriptional regulator [Deltaproteobacteria bacterium]